MNIHAIAEFMRLGGQTVPDDVDVFASTREMCGFLDRIDEEVRETSDALGFVGIGDDYKEIFGVEFHPVPTNHNAPEVLDGFIDAAYAALTGAIRFAGEEKAQKAWDAVVEANLSKVDGRYGPPILDPETGKIGKPKGWKAPDIEAIVYA